MVVGTVLFLVSGVFQWSPLNCWIDEVDIQSGRVRHTWLLLYCQVSQREEETWLSRAADSNERPPEWRRVNTFSPGSAISPHHMYHGAIHQIEMLSKVDDFIPFEPEARRQVANEVILLWQKGSYFEAGTYVEKVFNAAFDLADSGASRVTAADLP